MNKKYQSKLEDIENEVDSFKKKFVGVKGYTDKEFEEQVKRNAQEKIIKATEDIQKHLLKQINWDSEWDNIEVPTLRKQCIKCSNLQNGDIIEVDKEGNCLECSKNYIRITPESKVPLTAKITLVVMVFIIVVLLLV